MTKGRFYDPQPLHDLKRRSEGRTANPAATYDFWLIKGLRTIRLLANRGAAPADRERRKALATLMRMEWGADNPAIRQMFANYLMPGATKEQIESFNDLQRKTTSAECAARYFEATGNIDVVELLPQVRVPTLVMHARGDLQVPFELGRQLAAGIPGAKFVAMQSNNHILLEQDPATQRCFEEMRLFLN